MITRLLFALLLGAVSVLLLMVPFVGAFTVGLLLALFCALSGSLLAPYCKNSVSALLTTPLHSGAR
jgi:hypothetical protein